MTVGARIGVYQVEALLGAGGMGEVYRARDTRLERDVAIKILPPAFTADPDRLLRFEREARLLAALNHPNIATIHGLEEPGDASARAIVMELVEGETLAARLARHPNGVSAAEATAIAQQIVGALAAAHDKGIVHRDLKPANIMIRADGVVKILDFGLAKIGKPGDEVESQAVTATFEGTRQGVVLGTAAYMSPEQAQGRAVDARSDVFSFGVVLYEMLTGRAPFRGATMVETLAKVLESHPAGVRTLRADLPLPLASLVERCLEKDRARRPAASEIQSDLASLAAPSGAAPAVAPRGRRTALVSMAAAAVVAIAAGAWWYSGRQVRAARHRVPELMAAAARFDYDGFYRAAHDVIPLLPDDLQIKQVWLNMTIAVPIRSNPAGADVAVKGYSAVKEEWIPIGRTPLDLVRVPFGATRLRITKDGYTPFEGTLSAQPAYTLDAAGTVPEGMVRVPAGTTNLVSTSSDVPDFWMDRFEVTNRQFKAFVDAGGYRSREYWTEPFLDDGRTLSWNEAIARFLDKTGRPGPSTWELGTFPDGAADFPVAGVSWYEAAAYARYAGKRLPSGFQWRRAVSWFGGAVAGGLFSEILEFSNFSMKGPSAVGSHAGIGPFGTYDMAGNVKEWCWNETNGGRMILGGGWNETSYRYLDIDAQPPLHRGPTFGFRLVRNIAEPPNASYAPVRVTPQRDFSKEKPADDATFAILRGLYSYDPQPLNARVDRVEETPDWRRETVTLDAPYGGERLIVYVYLPKNAAPPFQSVIYFPGGDAPVLPSSRDLRLTAVDFIPRAGRVLLFPVYKGTFERRVEKPGPNAQRDIAIASIKDVRRVVEFVGSRPDLDRERIGFYGDSRGAFFGVMATAVEERLKASVLLGTGLIPFRIPPEVDPFNFAPRIHVPTLLVGGRSDFLAPVETAQAPLFRVVGVPPEHKKHALFEGGHAPSQFPQLIREILDWFDRYLGPITPRT